MSREKIIDTLKGILCKYFDITEEFRKENFDRTLITYFSFNYVDLVYLYILIEQTFNITIDRRQLKGCKFNTINGIIKVIMESVLV